VSPTLIQKIERLPPEKQAEVEDFVDFLVGRREQRRTNAPAFPRELLDDVDAKREALFREHGQIETDSIVRDLRENGGR
jgi:hypothetical protein